MKEGDALSLPNGWEVKTLEQVCNKVFAGGDKPKESFSTIKTVECNIPIYANGEKNKGLYGYTSITKVDKPSITVSARGTIGYSEIRNEPFYPIVRLIVLIPNEEIVDLKYLQYVISSMNFENSGTSIPQLTVPMIKRYRFSLPPLPEQKQIVAILDKAFAAIDQAKANIEKNIENAKELFQSKLNAIFSQQGEGWEEKRLQDISVEFGRGKSKHRPRNDKKLFGGKYPFVQTGDIRNSDKLVLSYNQTYNEVGLAQSKLWPKGTICITIAANIAETAITNFESCFPDSIIGVIVDSKKANVDYTYYALQYLKAELQAKGKGSAQDNINMGTFKDQYFPFPNIYEQQRIVDSLDMLKIQAVAIQSHYRQKLTNLEELKKSILQKAFSGALTSAVGTEYTSV